MHLNKTKKVLPIILAIALLAVACGGDEDFVGATSVSTISAGDDHTCAAIGDDNSIYCWGWNFYGQIGDETDGVQESRFTPTRVVIPTGENGFLSDVEFISSGFRYTCAIVGNERSAYCWGDNSQGQLGDGTITDKNAPIRVMAPGGGFLDNVASISTGGNHACAIVGDDDSAYCWGWNEFGQLGDETEEDKLVPTRVVGSEGGFLTDVASISAGGLHTCAVVGADNSAYCWGGNDVGELGNGTTSGSSIPISVSGPGGQTESLVGATSISIGSQYTCAIVGDDNSVYCWGKNNYGQLGDGTLDARAVPTRVVGSEGGFLTDVISVSAGLGHVCTIVRENRSAYCWGWNEFGQLGDETEEDKLVPTRPTVVDWGFLTDAASISAGSRHTCAIAEANDAAYCWGRNHQGQLGDGTANADKNDPKASPVRAP